MEREAESYSSSDSPSESINLSSKSVVGFEGQHLNGFVASKINKRRPAVRSGARIKKTSFGVDSLSEIGV